MLPLKARGSCTTSGSPGVVVGSPALNHVGVVPDHIPSDKAALMREVVGPIILDKGDPGFRELLLTQDSVTSNLQCQGIRAKRKSASIASRKHENILWEKELLGFDDPKALRRALA